MREWRGVEVDIIRAQSHVVKEYDGVIGPVRGGVGADRFLAVSAHPGGEGGEELDGRTALSYGAESKKSYLRTVQRDPSDVEMVQRKTLEEISFDVLLDFLSAFPIFCRSQGEEEVTEVFTPQRSRTQSERRCCGSLRCAGAQHSAALCCVALRYSALVLVVRYS